MPETRRLVVAEFISLDGVIQAPGSPDEDPSDGFTFGGWQVPFDDDAIGETIMGLFARPFELLLGRRTYDIWAAYWPGVGASAPDHPIAGPFNRVAKHVATHRPESLTWHNSHALKGALTDAVRALKQQDGPNLLTHGSGEMVRQLLAAGLVDELQLFIHPVVLGRGRRVFGDDAQPSAFTVARSTITPSGVVIARYVRGGDVRTAAIGGLE